MRIAYILPGSGDTFYCQNCVRDITLVRAMRSQGHDVVLVPLYLPLFADDQELADESPVFFGGVTAYLQQNFSLFRRTPRWLDRILDARPLLKSLAKYSGSTSASALGEMTISMLMGKEGHQAREVERLAGWLAAEIKPDIVHLSTALLLGLVPALRSSISSAIVCSLQDEDLWIDAMLPGHSSEVWRLVSSHARNTDAFAAVSSYYAGLMRGKMGTDSGKMHVIYPAVPFEEYSQAAGPPGRPSIGYLSRLSRPLGFEMMMDGFIRLRDDGRFSGVRLMFTGGNTGEDRKAASRAVRTAEKAGLQDDVEFAWKFNRAERIRFLQGLSLMSVPAVRGEAFGLHVIEALACGVPVVQPDAGAYTELVEMTGGGLLFEPGNTEAMVAAWKQLLLDPDAACRMGRKGRAEAVRLFSTEAAVKAMITLYGSLRG